MIVSILTRKIRIMDRAVCEGAVESVLPRIQAILEAEPGFLSVEYLWGTDELGRIAQITRWLAEDDCRNYIRNGGAATVATIEEAAVPTAPYPDGAWVRQTFAVAE